MRTIILPSRCDRAASEALLPEFLAALGGGPIKLDASQTTQIGQAMLQILVAARGSADGAAITASQALRDTAQLAGLSQTLFDEGDA